MGDIVPQLIVLLFLVAYSLMLLALIGWAVSSRLKSGVKQQLSRVLARLLAARHLRPAQLEAKARWLAGGGTGRRAEPQASLAHIARAGGAL